MQGTVLFAAKCYFLNNTFHELKRREPQPEVFMKSLSITKFLQELNKKQLQYQPVDLSTGSFMLLSWLVGLRVIAFTDVIAFFFGIIFDPTVTQYSTLV